MKGCGCHSDPKIAEHSLVERVTFGFGKLSRGRRSRVEHHRRDQARPRPCIHVDLNLSILTAYRCALHYSSRSVLIRCTTQAFGSSYSYTPIKMAGGQSTLPGASNPFRMGQNVKQTGHLADPAKQR